MSNHYILQDLHRADGRHWGTKSRGQFCKSAPTSAIVFIHGFWGRAIETWLEFPSLLTREPMGAGADIFYYGYDCGGYEVATSADRFRDLLVALALDPMAEVVHPSFPNGAPWRPRGLRYQSVAIVAHSAGAVVARRALIDLCDQYPSEDWVRRLRLVLFAPAHKGAAIERLLSDAIAAVGGPIGRLAKPIVRSTWPILDDLETGSETLRGLESATVDRLSRDASLDCLRAAVMHATEDKVVKTGRFGQDHPTTRYEGVDHQDVCKPHRRAAEPMVFLLRSL